MQSKLKQRWIDALTSGEYKQANNYLCFNSGFCCLGVLCDLVDNSKWASDTMHRNEVKYDFGDEGSSTCFPEPMWLKNVGLSYDIANELANMNDNGFSFAEIAKVIEEKVEVC